MILLFTLLQPVGAAGTCGYGGDLGLFFDCISSELSAVDDAVDAATTQVVTLGTDLDQITTDLDVRAPTITDVTNDYVATSLLVDLQAIDLFDQVDDILTRDLAISMLESRVDNLEANLAEQHTNLIDAANTLAGIDLDFLAPEYDDRAIEGCTIALDLNQCLSTPVCTSLGLCASRVFLTSTNYTGDLGGLGGADNKCQTRANAAGLSGTYIAWLGTSISGPLDRFNRTDDYAFRLLDGTPIADDFDDLIDGDIMAPIDVNEFGLFDSAGKAWTGVRSDGTVSGNRCLDWAWDLPGFVLGLHGAPDRSDDQWTQATSVDCDRSSRLYCFEQ